MIFRPFIDFQFQGTIPPIKFAQRARSKRLYITLYTHVCIIISLPGKKASKMWPTLDRPTVMRDASPLHERCFRERDTTPDIAQHLSLVIRTQDVQPIKCTCVYRAGRPIICQVLKTKIWGVPPAGGPLLLLPTAKQAGGTTQILVLKTLLMIGGGCPAL